MSLRDRLKNEIAYQTGYCEQAKKNDDLVSVSQSNYAIDVLNKVLSEVK